MAISRACETTDCTGISEIALQPESSRQTTASTVFSAACRRTSSRPRCAAIPSGDSSAFLNVAVPICAPRSRAQRWPVACGASAGARGFLRRPAGPGWALVGDAGYFKDPLTAHGITDALRDAELLARAMLECGPHDMAVYQRERDVLSIPLFEVTDAIASFQWTLDEIKALHGQPECSDEDRSELHGTAASCAQQGRVKAQEEPMSTQNSPWTRHNRRPAPGRCNCRKSAANVDA